MTDFSLSFPTRRSKEFAYYEDDYYILFTENSHYDYCFQERELREIAIYGIIFIVCISGLLGNGTVIWILGFCLKRTPFTTYILHLTVSNFGILMSSLFMVINEMAERPLPVSFFHHMHFYLFYFCYSSSQLLLTTISIDRCVSVLCPLWYQCHRSKKLPTILCALIWVFCILVHGICLFLQLTWIDENFLPLFILVLVNSMLCLTVITFSTLILFVRFCFKSQQHNQGNPLKAILLILFFFLIFTYPMNTIQLIRIGPMISFRGILNPFCYLPVSLYGLLCAPLNSFVGPPLYFLVGSTKRGLCRENPKLLLSRVFIEEEEPCGEEPGIQL